MATNVIMPSLGFDMTEGRLARWLKNEGDPVGKGQEIAEIETEKATVEIEAPAQGILAQIIVHAGETVPVGTVIAVIVGTGEKVEAVSAPAPTPPAPPAQAPAPEAGDGGAAPPGARVRVSPVARKMAEDAGLDLSRVKGTGPGGRVLERDVQ
ncbi:MAG: branched-chain alpha-keto acid dehydrogenase subunit, partial [Deltaproteobacteria bacterium]|nr:branched-chain alpha-keto acid dehydrogenase subunit [Deltaproteobacteria bacterium]